MIEEQGRVVSVGDGWAEVQVQKTSSCGSCSAGAACGTASLSRFFGQRMRSIRAANPVDAGVGDIVIVGLEDSRLLQASLILYGLPLLGLIVAAVLGTQLALALSFEQTEPLSILLGLMGMLAGLFVARMSAQRLAHSGLYQAVILRPAVHGISIPINLPG